MKSTLSILLGVLAALLPWGAASMGAEVCVETAEGLQAALTAAQSNGEDDVIQLVQGQYDGFFSYESDEGRSMALLGGFTTGCLSRDLDAANTTLRSQGRVLSLKNTLGGEILLEGLTAHGTVGGFGGEPGVALYASSSQTIPGDGQASRIMLNKNVFYRNGDRHASGVAAFTHAIYGDAGEIIVTGNLFRENRSMWNTGGLDAASHSDQGKDGAIRLVNNLFVGNSCSPYGQQQGNALRLSTSGEVVLTNNTVTGDEGSGESAVYVAKAGAIFVYNNIVWGNSAGNLTKPDILVYEAGPSYGFNNDYSSMVRRKCRGAPFQFGGQYCSLVEGSWSFSGGNLNADPLFEDPSFGDFHLQRVSPMIDAGSADAPDLPESDFEVNPRGNGDPSLVGPYPDIGVFEFVRLGPPHQPTVVNPTSLEDVEKSPVKVRMTGCENKVVETIVNLGPYRSPVDLYLAMGRPDSTYFLIDPQGAATSQWVPFRRGIIAAHDVVARREKIFTVSEGWSVLQGIWTLDWIIVPSTGATIEGIDWATDPYEQGWVYFQIPVLSAEWKPLPLQDRAGDALEFWMVAAGSKDHVVAMTTSGALYKHTRSFFTEGFKRLEPQSPIVRHVSVGCDGTLWYITWDGYLGKAAPNGTAYEWPSEPVPGPALIQISVGSGDIVWGVDAEGRIFRRKDEGWVQVEGELRWVSVGCDGTVWGVHETGQIFRMEGDHWTRIPGELTRISVGDSNVVWGVHPNGQIFKWLGDRWIQVDGALRQISAASDGTLWGVTPDLELVKNTFVCDQY